MTTVSQNADVSPLLYFRQNAGQLQSSSDNTTWNNVSSWPVTVNNTGATATLQVLFPTGLSITDANHHFICGSQRIQFGSRTLTNGLPTVITITLATSYPGFIQNGTSSANGNANISIFNIQIQATGLIAATNAGWLCQTYFSRNVTNWVVGCSSTGGTIVSNGGGVIGSHAGSESGGNLFVIGCWATNISATGIGFPNGPGYVVGGFACHNGGKITVERCIYIGNIPAESSGGIVGSNLCNVGAGVAVVRNCYSVGTVSSFNGAGIVGFRAGEGIGSSITIENCYLHGDVTGVGSGILGRTSSRSTVRNCYHFGNITHVSGTSIVGNGFTSSSIFILNCYSTGTMVNAGVSGIAGGISDNPNVGSSGNFSEALNGTGGSWNATRAANTLLMSAWRDISSTLGTPNTPFILLNALASPYEATNILANPDGTFSLDDTFSILAGTASSPTVVSTTSNRLIAGGAITPSVNNTTGVISPVSGLSPGSYTALVYSVMSVGYAITTITLTMPLIVVAPYPVITKLALDTERIKGKDYELRNELKSAAGLLEEQPRRILTDVPKFASNADYMAWKKARANAAYRQITLGL